jgi:hypothetical protein
MGYVTWVSLGKPSSLEELTISCGIATQALGHTEHENEVLQLPEDDGYESSTDMTTVDKVFVT